MKKNMFLQWGGPIAIKIVNGQAVFSAYAVIPCGCFTDIVTVFFLLEAYEMWLSPGQ